MLLCVGKFFIVLVFLVMLGNKSELEHVDKHALTELKLRPSVSIFKAMHTALSSMNALSTVRFYDFISYSSTSGQSLELMNSMANRTSLGGGKKCFSTASLHSLFKAN